MHLHVIAATALKFLVYRICHTEFHIVRNCSNNVCLHLLFGITPLNALLVAVETVVMVTTCVHVTCGLLAVLVLTTLVTSESSATERGGEDAQTAAAVEALARALQRYRHPAPPADQLSDDWSATKKREAALDVDYGWGGGRFGKRRMADRLGIGGRFGRSVDVVASRSASAPRTQDD